MVGGGTIIGKTRAVENLKVNGGALKNNKSKVFE